MPESKCPGRKFKMRARACLPLMVVPYSKAGRTRVYCCGVPEVVPDNRNLSAVADGGCNYIIRQHMCVEIPVRIGASAFAEDPYIICENCNGGESDELLFQCDAQRMRHHD